jgi:hypothetical protein
MLYTQRKEAREGTTLRAAMLHTQRKEAREGPTSHFAQGRKELRAEHEAKGYRYLDDGAIVVRLTHEMADAPPRNVIERLADLMKPAVTRETRLLDHLGIKTVYAQESGCDYDPSGCDSGGYETDIYPYDDGTGGVDYADDTYVMDWDDGVESWTDDGLDTTTNQSLWSRVKGWWTNFNISYSWDKTWHGIPCLDPNASNPYYINPAIIVQIRTDAKNAVLAQVNWGVGFVCALSGVNFFNCVGMEFLGTYVYVGINETGDSTAACRQ